MTVSRCFALVTFSLIVLHCLGASIFVKRATDDSDFNLKSNNSEENAICYGSTPCGWAVYNKFNRKIMYFMKNPCTCPDEKQCILMDDDLQTTAYVYRCVIHTNQNSTTTSFS